MKTAVTLSRRGTVTLPAAMRRAMAIEPGTRWLIELTPDGLLLRPATAPSAETYTVAREAAFDHAERELAAVISTPIPAARRR